MHTHEHEEVTADGTATRVVVILAPNTTRKVPSLLRTSYIQTHTQVVVITRTPSYFSKFPNVTCLEEDVLEVEQIGDEHVRSLISSADLLILDDILYDTEAAAFDRAVSFKPGTLVIVMQASCHVRRVIQAASVIHAPSNNERCCRLHVNSADTVAVYSSDAVDLKDHIALV